MFAAYIKTRHQTFTTQAKSAVMLRKLLRNYRIKFPESIITVYRDNEMVEFPF